MEQKDLEARLVALGAEYGKKKTAIENQIRILRINLEEQTRQYNEVVCEIKKKIYSLENDLSEVKQEFHCKRSDIYDCNAASNTH